MRLLFLLACVAACDPEPIAGARGDGDGGHGGSGGEKLGEDGGDDGRGGAAGCAIELGRVKGFGEGHAFEPFTGGELRVVLATATTPVLPLEARLHGFESAGGRRDAWIRSSLYDGEQEIPVPFESCAELEGEPARVQTRMFFWYPRGVLEPPVADQPLTLRVRAVSHADLLECREPQDPAACDVTIEVPVTIRCCDPR